MAVDTETKRRSALGMLLTALVVLPVPNATIGRADRGHVLGIYRGGIATDAVHILSTGEAEPNHVADSGSNVLVKNQIEVQGGGFFGGATTNFQTEADGDSFWVGAGTGLPYGSFWGNDLVFVAAGGTGTYFEIADADITVGQINLSTFQNNKELAVTKAGMYKVVWSMSVKATGANKHIVGGIGVDAGGAGALTIQNDGRSHAVSTGNAEFALSGTAILDLSASSEVGLMATNETDNTNITIEHVSLSLLQVGGT